MIAELQACVDSGCSRAVEASMMLALLKKFFIDEEEEGDKIILRLQSLYPNSLVICYLSGFIARLNGELDKAVQLFEKVSVISKEVMNSTQLHTTAQYHMGYCKFVQNDWEAASKCFELFITQDVNSTGKRFRPYTSYQLGFCYWKLGRKEEIEPLYIKAKDWVRAEQSYDKFAARKMDQFLKDKRFSPVDEVVIPTAALLEARLWKQALHLVETLIPLLKDPAVKTNRDYFALYYFYKAEALKGVKHYDRAKQMYERVIAEETHLKTETFLVPYSWTGLGEIALEEKEWALSEQHFNKAKTYTNYDWAQLLSFRIYGKVQLLELRRKKSTNT